MNMNLVVLLAVLLPILAGAGTFFYVRKRRNQPPTETPVTPANGKEITKSNPGHLILLGVDKRAATIFYGDTTNRLVFEVMIRADISTAKQLKGEIKKVYPEAILFLEAFQGKEEFRHYGVKSMQDAAREYLLSLPTPQKTASAPPKEQKTG